MILRIRVYPRKRSQKVYFKNGEAFIHVRSNPDKSLANQEAIDLLAEYYKVHRSNIRIVSGSRSRDKLVEISE